MNSISKKNICYPDLKLIKRKFTVDDNSYEVICYLNILCQSNIKHGIISLCRGWGVFPCRNYSPGIFAVYPPLSPCFSLCTLCLIKALKCTYWYFLWISQNQIYSFVCVYFRWPRLCLNLIICLCRIPKRFFSTSTIVAVTSHWSVERSDTITSTPVSPPVHVETATRWCC